VFGPYSSLETYMKALAAKTGDTVAIERAP
jgi:hypothetical protein